ncbi:hypothetical protein FRC07_001805 [Ceratobasidium sp. 392]|nr:hypothetical protein FRC07_001805 [Ceratobasidium sp. 392]
MSQQEKTIRPETLYKFLYSRYSPYGRVLNQHFDLPRTQPQLLAKESDPRLLKSLRRAQVHEEKLIILEERIRRRRLGLPDIDPSILLLPPPDRNPKLEAIVPRCNRPCCTKSSKPKVEESHSQWLERMQFEEKEVEAMPDLQTVSDEDDLINDWKYQQMRRRARAPKTVIASSRLRGAQWPAQSSLVYRAWDALKLWVVSPYTR